MDESLLAYYRHMSLSVANNVLDFDKKRLWVQLHNEKANLYFLSQDGIIKEFPHSGWYY